jgi:hypothetical protein
MVVMLPRVAGGYSEQLGWTGLANDKVSTAEPPGRFSDTFEEDAASEMAGWVTLETHLADAKSAAVQITDALALDSPHRTAVVTAAELHDIGKAHKVWQGALPVTSATTNALWAKAPFVFVLSGKISAAVRKSTGQLLTAAGIHADFFREEVRDDIPRQLWTVSEKIRDTRSRKLLSEITGQASGLKGWMRRFLPRPSWDKPCIRHEAASALAAWPQYFKASASWPGLTLFLIACHHGKVRPRRGRRRCLWRPEAARVAAVGERNADGLLLLRSWDRRRVLKRRPDIHPSLAQLDGIGHGPARQLGAATDRSAATARIAGCF